MILDKFTEFCDATSAVINVGNAIIGNVIDLGASPTLKSIGNGEPVYLVVQIDTAIAGTSSTLQLKLLSDSTANLATSATVHWDSGAIAEATLVAGYTWIIPLPAAATYERYLGLWEWVAVANLSAGKINAFLTHDPAKWIALPDGI